MIRAEIAAEPEHMKAHDLYKRLEIPSGTILRPCPVCGADAELWQFSKSETAPTNKLVVCSNGDAIGPQAGLVNEGCLLFMPPDEFYQATIREGVKFWNEYADALEKLQRANRWKRAKVLREQTP